MAIYSIWLYSIWLYNIVIYLKHSEHSEHPNLDFPAVLSVRSFAFGKLLMF